MQELAPSPIEDDEADYYYNAEQLSVNPVERKATDLSSSNYSNYSQSSSNLTFWCKFLEAQRKKEKKRRKNPVFIIARLHTANFWQ